MRKAVIACDSYKGCLPSSEVAEAVAEGIRAVHPECETVSLAVADGGEGTVDALMTSLGGRFAHAVVSDPLGRPVDAAYGIAGDLAVIESAAACGLTLLREEERNPLLTTTRGLGELILAAVDEGCRRFLIGLGGSATNDGGMGMIGTEGFLKKTKGLEFGVACDVDTPFIGPSGASRVFAPQKGASAADVEILEGRMEEYAAKILKETGVDVREMPGSGAAGGLGGAFRAYLGAELKRGVDLVLDSVGFDSAIDGADLVITGEGCSDFQTLKGKTPSGVLERASRAGIPVVLLSGAVRDEQLLRGCGFRTIERATPVGMDLEEAMRPETARKNIREAIKRILSDE